MKIERGVPIPRVDPKAVVARKMKLGDSVPFATQSEAQKFAQVLYQETKETKYRQLLRKVDGGWRVWKIRRDDDV